MKHCKTVGRWYDTTIRWDWTYPCLPRRSLWLSALVPSVAKARHWNVMLLGSHSKCLFLLTFAVGCLKLWRQLPCQFWRQKFWRKLRERPWPVLQSESSEITEYREETTNRHVERWRPWTWRFFCSISATVKTCKHRCISWEVAIITGATSGVGLEAARILAANGCEAWALTETLEKTWLKCRWLSWQLKNL